MKRSFSIIAFLAVILPMMLSAYSASFRPAGEVATDTVNDWCASDVVYLQEHKGEFANKKMSDLYSFLIQKGMEVKDVWTKDTSPFADPHAKGRAYVRGLYLFSRVLEDLDKGEKYYEIYVELNLPNNDTSIVAVDFWRSFDNSKSEVKQFVQKTKDMIIRNIEIRQDTIIGNN